MRVDVTLPALLRDVTGDPHVALDAPTLRDAIDQLRAHPRLGPLIFDDAGALRPHVLLFHNEQATRWLETLDVPLAPGDRLAVVQATSGG